MGDQTYRIFFLLPPEVHLLDISGPIHVFYEAKCLGAPIELNYLTMNGARDVRSSAGVVFSELQDFADMQLTPNDVLFIPGLDKEWMDRAEFQQTEQPFYHWLRAQSNEKAIICSVCTGAYLLGYAGLLDQRACTTHWKYLQDFAHRFPAAKLHDDRLFVQDEHLFTSAGVSSGIDLSLFLLEQLFDPELTIQVAKEIVVFLRRTAQDPQLSVFLSYRNHIDNRIHQVQDLLAQQLTSRLKIEELASAVHMSPRNLTRLFKKTAGVTIGSYHDQLRLERASQLLVDGQKVEVAASACGLSANQLRSLLQKYGKGLPSNMS